MIRRGSLRLSIFEYKGLSMVRFATNGKIIADTLRSYISYAKCEEDTDGMLVHQWDRNEEEPVHE